MTTDAKILLALRDSPDGVSGADLAGQLGVTRAAIWGAHRAVAPARLRIEAGPHFGYRLVSAPDVLHADDLLARLGKTKVIGRDIRVFEQTTSTNDVIEKLARDGVKEARSFLRVADEGRGRLGRKWISPERKDFGFHFAATGYAPAGSDAIDGCFRNGSATRNSIRNRFASRNQMAERHFNCGKKSRAF